MTMTRLYMAYRIGRLSEKQCNRILRKLGRNSDNAFTIHLEKIDMDY